MSRMRFALVCVALAMLALLGVSQAQTVKVVAYAASNSRITVSGAEARVYSAANQFSTGAVNGPSSVSVYQKWSYFGANTKLVFVSATEAIISSSGDFLNDETGDTGKATATVRLTTNPGRTSYEIKGLNGVVWQTSAGLKPITWGSNRIKSPGLSESSAVIASALKAKKKK